MSRANEVPTSANTFAFGKRLTYQNNVEMRVKLHTLNHRPDIASLRNEPAHLKVEDACNARPTSFYI